MMAGMDPEKSGGKTYLYVREVARVDGRPKMVSERYLGSAADIAAAVAGAEQAMLPQRSRHQAFGAVAAAWGILTDLGVPGLIDEVIGPRRRDVRVPAGTYLALAALNRIVEPCSKRGFARWWATTAADRFLKTPAAALDHRKFWDAIHAVTPGQLEEVSHRLAVAMAQRYQLDCSSVSLDMTNFATFIDTGNEKAPIAKRGKAKQKRTDLRLVGLGLVVTRDGGIPLTWHAYPGTRPDVTQFPAMIDQLEARYAAVCADLPAQASDPDLTVVFDAGQNSQDNFAHLGGKDLHYVGSVPASDCPDLLTIPARRLAVLDEGRFGGLTGYDTRREVYGAQRRAILTHSPQLHAAQARSFDGTTLAKATRKSPKDHRLDWHIDQAAHAALETELFGKHVLITSRDDWPAADVVAAYRSQSDAEFSFRQMKDPHVVSFSPMHHWTDHNIRVHLFTCVLALVTAHLMRRHAARHGMHMSVRALLDALAGIEETVLIYPSTGGRPKARRMLTEMSPDQQKLYAIFSLDRWAPRA